MPVQPNDKYMPNHLSLLERLAILGRIYDATDRVTIQDGTSAYWYAEIPPEDVQTITFLNYRLRSFNAGGIIYRLWVNPTSYTKEPDDLLIPPAEDSAINAGRASNVVLGDAVLAQYDEIPLTVDGILISSPGVNQSTVTNFQPSTPNVSIIIQAENVNLLEDVDFTIMFQWAEGTIITTPN